MDIHASIQAFLQQQTIRRLTESDDGDGFTKAGVVPFVEEEGVRHYYLMKPIARHKDLAAPEFQLCKGTRMRRTASGWRDMRDGMGGEGEKESLAATALREGIEELGLTLEGIAGLYDLGPYRFASAKTGQERLMWLFAAEMQGREGFLPDRDVAMTTAARGWLTLTQFDIVGRKDHRYILRDIEARLSVCKE